MKHTSIRLEDPCELINITPLNPLISKCQIKVCYVGDQPNRNGSVITKDVAKEMANSLPGSPIVGFYNENTGDFEEHNRVIDISNNKFDIKDTTRPYGFVDLNAKVWFQKFLDDGTDEHEYLMTEGYLWTGQYPEAKRVITDGNNQSMELDEKTLNAHWTKDNKGKPEFFIINEAIISKLCILGEDVEPCFEGSTITKVQFSFEDGFKEQLFSMMNQLKEFLKEGGAQVFTRYAVEIGDSLWSALYSYVESTYPDSSRMYCSMYSIEGVYEEGGQKFAVLQSRGDMKYYRLNFSISETDGFKAQDTLVEVTKTFNPSEDSQFSANDVEAYESEYAKKKTAEKAKTPVADPAKDPKEDPKTDPKAAPTTDPTTDPEEDPKKKKKFSDSGEELCPKCGKPLTECACGGGGGSSTPKKKKKEYTLEEIPEYVDLKSQFDNLTNKFNALQADKDKLDSQIKPLIEFKQKVELAEKKKMIESFYMLTDEDKKDVIDNINTYSLDDIEAKLSIICVRNKVSFDLDDDKHKGPTTFNLTGGDLDDTNTPAWIKAVESVAKSRK